MKTILYVDDNPEKMQELKTHFPDFKIIFFSNPLEASYEASFHDYDILFLDIMMPFLDGFGVYDKITSLKNYKKQPTFFISDTNDEELMLKALQLGAEDLLTSDMPWSVKRQRVLNKLNSLPETHREWDGIKFNFLDSIIRKEGKVIELTRKEMLLMKNVYEKKMILKEELEANVWGAETSMAKNNLATHLSNLNKKINPLGIKVKSRRGIVTLNQL